ncbi:MAG: AI-2E family transporter [Acidobacteria bacterium]|nr:AI-2E family transporter [Acidobacteriota bacterium]
MDGTKIDRIPYFLVIAASLVVIFAGLRSAAAIIVPFLISVFVAIISLPLQNWLVARKVPRSLAVVFTLFADILVLVGFGFLIGGSVQGFTAKWPEYQSKLIALVTSLTDWLNSHGASISGDSIVNYLKSGIAFDIVRNAFGRVASLVQNFVLVFLTILFVLSEAAGFSEKLERAVGRSMRETARLDKIKRDIQQYLVVKTFVSLATGLLVWVSLALIGLDFPILWGLLAFLLNYIPSLGSIIAAVPPVLLALVQLGSGRALAVAAVFVAVNVVLGNLVEPSLMGRRLGLSALVVFLSLVFWGWVWGPVGMILSVPLTMILKIMLENTRDLRWIAVMLGSGREETPQNK